jgi:hypothetical protein
MIKNGDTPVAGVTYWLRFGGDVVDIITSGAEALRRARTNPGMVVEAEIWRVDENGTEVREAPSVVYPLYA